MLGLVLAVIGLIIAFMLAGYIIQKQLGAEIIKINQAGEPITFLDLQAELSPPIIGEDAAPYYNEAIASISPAGLENLRSAYIFYRKNIILLPPGQFPGDVRDKIARNLTNSQPVLQKFDQAADLPMSHFDTGIEQGIQACKARIDRTQTAAFLLSLRTLHLLLSGRDDAAVNSVISLLKMTRIFQSHPTMISYVARLAFVGRSCEDILLLLERAHPSDKAMANLQKVLSQTFPANAFEAMFLAERVRQLEIARNLIPKNIVSQFLPAQVPNLPERLKMPASRLRRLRIQRNAARYLRNMAWLITVARRPWPQPLDAIAADAPELTEKLAKLISSSEKLAHVTARNFTLLRCTTLAVAVERYRRSHGRLPPSLDDLAGDYIDSIPLDPFTGKKLLYRHDDQTYVIYSTGIDRRDDGGDIILQPGKKNLQDQGVRIRLHKPK